MTHSSKKPWKYTLVQHPMWLIIAEDSVCAERTPPWGCASLEDYAERLGICLDALDKYPQMHLSFDFSAVELEDLAERFPELMQRIKNLTIQGSMSFLNGTYSQPHLQILSVESAIRQFEYGIRSIENLTGYRTTCYAAQEPGFSPQLPQILRAMGYKSSTTVDFPFGVHLEHGQIQHWSLKWEWIDCDDFINWKAPDGTTIPIWLKTSGWPNEAVMANEVQHGLLRHTRLRVDMPDMMEITPEWVEAIERVANFSQLDKTIEEMLASDPPEAVGWIDANYAYVEGADVEGLSRANMQAETALLTLETAAAFLASGKVDFDFDAAWKIFLKAQHHDAYWIGGPELRAKSIAWLEEISLNSAKKTKGIARSFARNLPAAPADTSPVLVVHPYAKSHSAPVELQTNDCALVDTNGKTIPTQTRSNNDGSTSAVFVTSAKGIGYQTLFLKKEAERVKTLEKALAEPHTFSNDYYSASVKPDGTIASLAAHGGSSLLNGYEANVWLYEDNGSDVFPQAAPESTKLTQGQVYDCIEAQVTLGPIRLSHTLTFYHALPWFTVETELYFDEPTEIGDYFDDRTKLHYAWPIGSEARIRHAVGGCPASARKRRSFMVSPWLDAAVGEGRVAFCLFNATKCWLDETGYLRFLAAWGHNGDRFHNRQGPYNDIMGPLNWFKPMDLRLRGSHTVKYAVWPHAGEAADSQVADWAGSLLMPPIAYQVETGSGAEPWSATLFGVETEGVLPLSVRTDGDNGAVARLMDMKGEERRLEVSSDAGWDIPGIRNLDGADVNQVGPHKIVEASLARPTR